MDTPTPTSAPETAAAPEQVPAEPTKEPQTWYQAVALIEPHIVRLSTTRGQGTGFLVSIGTDMCAIATAAHVVDHAHYWEEPVRVDHVSSGKTLLVRHAERALFLDLFHDTAAMLMMRGDIPFPNFTLPLAPKGKFLRVGNDIGWLGISSCGQYARLLFRRPD